MTEWSTFPLCIQKDMDSNLGLGAKYSKTVFYSSSKQMLVYKSEYATTTLFHNQHHATVLLGKVLVSPFIEPENALPSLQNPHLLPQRFQFIICDHPTIQSLKSIVKLITISKHLLQTEQQ
jgi:hypothetical protein